MSRDTELIIGLGFLGLLGISACVYAAWNILVRKRKRRFAAQEDAKLLKLGLITENEFFQKMRSLVPSLITANSLLAGISIIAIFTIIAQVVFQRVELHGMEQGIMMTALSLVAISAICWLYNSEQFIQMLAPSVDCDRLLKFQRYAYNLWTIGLTLILISMYLFLLLVNLYVAMAVGFVTLLIVIGYFKIHCGW
jgi:hypothetical protein